MGCGCNKAKTPTAQFVLKTSDGQTSTHSSRREAERADQTHGGGGTITRKV